MVSFRARFALVATIPARVMLAFSSSPCVFTRRTRSFEMQAAFVMHKEMSPLCSAPILCFGIFRLRRTRRTTRLPSDNPP